ncbi:MAG: gamma-glutamyltransferase [Thermomicrobiales bacterium]
MTWSNNGLAHRPVVMGTNGMVASAHPLASLAGVRILQQGGNAIDAAVATAATLNVVEPYMSGLGGGGYMLIHLSNGDTRVLDYSGVTSANVDIEELTLESIDVGGKAPVVPGAPDGWLTAVNELGTMSITDVFAPAIEYAEAGAPLTITNARFYEMAGSRLDETATKVFWPSGATPGPAAIIKQPALAHSLKQLASEGSDIFYKGEMGKETVRAVQAVDGYLTEEDLAAFSSAWCEPLSAGYRGYEIRTVGAPATSFQVPATLKLLEGFDLKSLGQNSVETIHLMAESMKLAVADRIRWAGDLDAPFDGLFSNAYAESRRATIDRSKARPVEGERYSRPLPEGAVRPGSPEDFARENTTHFDVVDRDGNGVSVTQSLGSFFGSGVMAGNTGIMLNNFSHFFDLDPESANAIGPSTPRMTSMAPTIIFRDSKPFLLIGTPGAFGILQTTVQMISNVLDHEYSVQAAIEAPRFRIFAGNEIAMESRVPESVRAELTELGHEIRLLDDWSPVVGGGQGIMIDPESGAFGGGADPRRDGYAIGW